MSNSYFKNKSFLKFSKQHQTNILKNNYPLLFKNINFNSTDTDINNCVKKQEEYNNKNAKYLNLKEVDCNLNKKFNPFENTINEPIILRGFYKDTIAFNKWNKDNLTQKFGKNKIKVEYYINYLGLINHEVDCVKKYNMSQFLEKMNKEYIYIGETSIDNFKKNSLYDDLDNPRIKINDTYDTVVFCGNKNTGSHTHIHLQAYDYILNQVIGTKTMYLFDLNDNIDQNIGLSSPFNNSTRFIFDYNRFDTFNLRLINHEKLKIYKVTLNPGDSLIIPPWWWHNAICDDFSLSITDLYERDTSYFYKYPSLLYTYIVTSLFDPKHVYSLLTFIDEKIVSILYDNEFDFNSDKSKKNKKNEQYLTIISCILFYIFVISFFTIILYFILHYFNFHIPIYYLVFIVFTMHATIVECF